MIFDKYSTLIDVLENLEENPTSWDDTKLTEANGLLHYLTSFLFCFLVQVFNKIFEQLSIVYDILQNRNTDFSYGVGKIDNSASYLTGLRSEDGFKKAFSSAVEIVGHPSSRSDRKHNYRQLYFPVLDNI